MQLYRGAPLTTGGKAGGGTLSYVDTPAANANAANTYTVTNKLLIQAGASFLDTNIRVPTGGYGLTKNLLTAGGTVVEPSPTTFSIRELSTGYAWGARAGSGC